MSCCWGAYLVVPTPPTIIDAIDCVEHGYWNDSRLFTDIGVWFDLDYNA